MERTVLNRLHHLIIEYPPTTFIYQKGSGTGDNIKLFSLINGEERIVVFLDLEEALSLLVKMPSSSY